MSGEHNDHDHKHEHKHEHHDHGHEHAHGNKELPVHKTEKTLSNAWDNFKTDVEWRLKKSIDPHAKGEVHGDHVHAAITEVTTLDKLGIAAGSTVSLGVAIHGLVNIKRGLAGWEDKELEEKHAPSAQYTIVGAAETLGGLALLKRLLTGTYKVF